MSFTRNFDCDPDCSVFLEKEAIEIFCHPKKLRIRVIPEFFTIYREIDRGRFKLIAISQGELGGREEAANALGEILMQAEIEFESRFSELLVKGAAILSRSDIERIVRDLKETGQSKTSEWK